MPLLQNLILRSLIHGIHFLLNMFQMEWKLDWNMLLRKKDYIVMMLELRLVRLSFRMRFRLMGFLGEWWFFHAIYSEFSRTDGCLFPDYSFAGDANDDFIVEIAPQTRGGYDKKKARERIRSLRSHFRLRHVMTGCYLFSHKVKLPEWGFEQQEVRVVGEGWDCG